MVHSQESYEAFESWISENITDTQLERAIQGHSDPHNPGLRTDQTILLGIRDAMADLRGREETRLNREGRDANLADSITRYYNRVFERGSGPSGLSSDLRDRDVVRNEVTGGTVNVRAVLNEQFGREEVRRDDRSKALLVQQAIRDSTSVEQAIQNIQSSGRFSQQEQQDLQSQICLRNP